MKYYVDVVSGLGPLHELSNKRFDELKDIANKRKTDVIALSQNDDTMIAVRHFEKCYFDGSVSSVCSRRVIDANILLENINRAFTSWQTELHEYAAMDVLHAALKGVARSCSTGDQTYYQPKTEE